MPDHNSEEIRFSAEVRALRAQRDKALDECIALRGEIALRDAKLAEKDERMLELLSAQKKPKEAEKEAVTKK